MFCVYSNVIFSVTGVAGGGGGGGGGGTYGGEAGDVGGLGGESPPPPHAASSIAIARAAVPFSTKAGYLIAFASATRMVFIRCRRGFRSGCRCRCRCRCCCRCRHSRLG